MIPQQSLDCADVTCVDSQPQLDRDLIAVRDPLAGLLVTHRRHHATRQGQSPGLGELNQDRIRGGVP